MCREQDEGTLEECLKGIHLSEKSKGSLGRKKGLKRKHGNQVKQLVRVVAQEVGTLFGI